MLKKRFLPISLLAFCLLTQTNAWAISIPMLERKAAIAQTNENTVHGLPIINWQEFKMVNEKTKQENETFAPLYNQLLDLISVKNGTFAVSALQGTPKYASVIENANYIFIGEDHNEPAVQYEIEEIIRAVRHANPNKKILLASEFVRTPEPLTNPLRRANSPESPLLDDYYNTFKLADELEIDTLALDDEILEFVNRKLIKVGDRYVQIDINNDSQTPTDILAIGAAFKAEIDQEKSKILQTIELLLMVRWQIYASDWGVKQRNYQWVKRIRDVEQEYDIVIIWAGSGHTSRMKPSSLPFLLASSNAVEINFDVINSHRNAKSEDFFRKAFKVREELGLCSDRKVYSKDHKHKVLKSNPTIDSNKTYYFHIETDYTNPKLNAEYSENEIAQIEALNERIKTLIGQKEMAPSIYSIYVE